nr:hypothetical protein [Tanacetum cinerariifolium]
MDFQSSTNSSTNRAINTTQAVNIANGVSTASTQVNAAFSTNIDNLSDDVICAFMASQLNKIKHKESTIRSVPVETHASTAMVSYDVLVDMIGVVRQKKDLNKFVVKPVDENVKAKSSIEATKAVRKNNDALIIKEWVSDDEIENVTQHKIVKKIVRPNIVKKEFVKPRQQEKTARKTIKKVEHNRQNTHRPRGNQRN